MAKLPEAKRVFAFNAARILIGAFRSIRAAAEVSLGQAQGISNSANAHAITSLGYYWRHEHSDVEVEISDIGVLTLEEFDELCQIKREYLPSKSIRGKRVLPLANKTN